ncbi:hypothetical protein PHYPSEUDO_004524 [Phytophthora pseudosyringae]|uniref:Uncharacterized protein n=1 Tax=Phytophthora pseudosyringae TaxID=221518 RepID=A0A8T1WKR3_9STRA|nr:hypothetical protein PHYPSEUDO_004524 [Phytophthora pseudosyringae]
MRRGVHWPADTTHAEHALESRRPDGARLGRVATLRPSHRASVVTRYTIRPSDPKIRSSANQRIYTRLSASEKVSTSNAAAKNKHMVGAFRLASAWFSTPLLNPPSPPSSPQTAMPNLLKDLVSMVSPQAKRPLQSPSTTNRLSPAKQNVASGPFSDFAARRENANAAVAVEQQQEQAKMDSFVFFNMLR